MTGPNPDAALDAALGVVELPPAVVTDEHLRRSLAAIFRAGTFEPADVDDLSAPYARQVRDVAQAIADAEQRGAARVLAEHAAAGTSL